MSSSIDSVVMGKITREILTGVEKDKSRYVTDDETSKFWDKIVKETRDVLLRDPEATFEIPSEAAGSISDYLAEGEEEGDVEEKSIIRRVASPEGARRYKQPIGSIILPGKPNLPFDIATRKRVSSPKVENVDAAVATSARKKRTISDLLNSSKLIKSPVNVPGKFGETYDPVSREIVSAQGPSPDLHARLFGRQPRETPALPVEVYPGYEEGRQEAPLHLNLAEERRAAANGPKKGKKGASKFDPEFTVSKKTVKPSDVWEGDEISGKVVVRVQPSGDGRGFDIDFSDGDSAHITNRQHVRVERVVRRTQKIRRQKNPDGSVKDASGTKLFTGDRVRFLSTDSVMILQKIRPDGSLLLFNITDDKRELSPLTVEPERVQRLQGGKTLNVGATGRDFLSEYKPFAGTPGMFSFDPTYIYQEPRSRWRIGINAFNWEIQYRRNNGGWTIPVGGSGFSATPKVNKEDAKGRLRKTAKEALLALEEMRNRGPNVINNAKGVEDEVLEAAKGIRKRVNAEVKFPGQNPNTELGQRIRGAIDKEIFAKDSGVTGLSISDDKMRIIVYNKTKAVRVLKRAAARIAKEYGETSSAYKVINQQINQIGG